MAAVSSDANGDGTIAKDSTQTEQELAVGIDIYVSPEAPGFTGILKQRYTDFLVNEVLPNGEVLHLTDANPTATLKAGQKRLRDEEANGDSVGEEDAPTKKLKVDAALPEPKAEEGKPQEQSEATEVDASITEEGRAALISIFGESVVDDIQKLYGEVLKKPTLKPRDHRTIVSDPIEEKPKRTEAHVAVRKYLSGRLETSTLQDGSNSISIKAASPKGGSSYHQSQPADRNGAKQKGKLGWEQLGGEYLHFTLYKENKDTMEVLYFIASQLKIHIKHFQFAGTKDRRGVTVQKVCVFRTYAERLTHVQKMARGWRLGGFEYRKHGLELGELRGNEFVITLRDCHFPGVDSTESQTHLALAHEAVSKATSAFAQRGYLNYYGLQRFGSFSTGTHTTGMKMLQGNLGAAIDGILAFDTSLLPENQDSNNPSKVPEDDIRRADAINHWRTTKDAREACAKMPRRFQAEYSIIQYVGKKEKKTGRLTQEHDWQGALMSIQRNLRLMYVHAYQSFVWNTVAGKRWNLYGDQVIEGDLVIVGEKDGEDVPEVQQELDEDGEPIIRPAANDTASSAEDRFTRARTLSKEEAESGKYDIFDIVLPLPGFDVQYPQNEVGKFFESFMASEAGGSLDPHNMRRAWKDISLSGGYRKTMARPTNLKCEVKEYVDELAQLVETDLERLKKESEQVDANGSAEGTNGDTVSTQQNDVEEGQSKKLAVVLRMQLGSSQYATMALRELMKGGAASFKPDFNTAR